MNQGTIKDLAPERLAVLSLLLTQGRSYDEIADALKIDHAAVRTRAHTAADELATGDGPPPSAGTRALIADYLLGQQSHAERVRTCYALADSEIDRDWAKRLARAIAPLSKVPLPVIPGAGSGRPAAPESKTPPQRAGSGSRQRHSPPDHTRHRRTPIALGLLAIAGAAILAVVLLTGGSGKPKPVAAFPAVTKSTKVRGRTLRRLVLLPAGANKRAFGAGAIVSQGASMLLLLQARGLQPNRHNSYGVWLFNTPGDAQLLGFISPPVGSSGAFSSGTTLPQDAVRFHDVIVTSETKASPSAPGLVVLRAALPFS